MGNCNIPDNDPLNVECIVETPAATTDNSCQTTIGGTTSCPQTCNTSPWSLADMDSDSCYISDLVAQALAIGAADVNVYKLLGVHEQGKLVDITGNGSPISNGDIPNYPASNAFDKYITEWRSQQLGTQITASSYLGYDFGEIKLLYNDRNRYGIETFVRKDVATLKIKQGCNSQNRASQIRVERSSDGKKWFGVTVLSLPDCDGLVTLSFNKSVPSRWWRIRPVTFNGGSSDWWSVQALQMMDYEATQQNNIQDRLFLENRDRDYDTSAITVKGSYTPPEVQTYQSKYTQSGLFGGGDTYSIEVSFAAIVGLLGRPLVIGDIIQLPSQTQYSPTLQPILKYLEITDVAWSVNGYTPNWKPTLQRIIAEPLMASRETQDITGKLTQDIDSTGLVDIDDGSMDRAYQDYSNISQTVAADANSAVPERGEDYGDVTKLSPAMHEWQKQNPEIDVLKFDRRRMIYGIDGMPPNGLPYTEGDIYPVTPKNGDYHRLTYTHIGNDIAPVLYRWSGTKSRWIFMERDRRFQMKNTQPVLQEFLDPDASRINPHDINDKYK